jgi:hypothetical protein
MIAHDIDQFILNVMTQISGVTRGICEYRTDCGIGCCRPMENFQEIALIRTPTTERDNDKLCMSVVRFRTESGSLFCIQEDQLFLTIPRTIFDVNVPIILVVTTKANHLSSQ